MARNVLFIVLLAVIALFGVLSYEVLSSFILPMFLAVLLVVMFRPLHEYFLHRCQGHVRIAAGLTTVAILLIVLLPLAWIGYRAAVEVANLTRNLSTENVVAQVEQVLHRIEARLPESLRPANEVKLLENLKPLVTSQWDTAAKQAGQVIGSLVQLLVALGIMIVALYYFLADGPELLKTFTNLTPLKEQHKQHLIREFGNLTRAVILAMIAAAATQGVMAGVGYYFAGIPNVFLLSVLTIVLAMVPFVGATLVWVPCVLWLFFAQDQQMAAILLGLYCAVVVSMADNLIKPMVLHGRSNLHPLLGLLSVLGGAKALGPIGIVLGPMIVAFFQTLLVILHNELAAFDARPAEGKT